MLGTFSNNSFEFIFFLISAIFESRQKRDSTRGKNVFRRYPKVYFNTRILPLQNSPGIKIVETSDYLE